MNDHCPSRFGAALDGVTSDTAALQRALDAAGAQGGGTVVVPVGCTLLSGHVRLPSRVELRLAPGATLRASLDERDYRAPCLLGADGAEDIAVTGPGTIDGRGTEFMGEELPHIFRFRPWRPKLVHFENCRRVDLRDCTLRHSPHYTVHLGACDDVAIRGLRILNHLKIPNGDGIDPDCCRNVRISDCHIEAGDDCIVLKASRAYAHHGPCENVVVTNCTLVSTSAALKLGTETVAGIRHVAFSNCVVRGSHRGLAVVLRDAGDIEHVSFSNITIETRLFHPDWWGGAESIYVSAHPRTPGGAIGRLRDVRFAGIRARGEAGVFVTGSVECRPSEIVFDDVAIELAKTSRHAAGRRDVRPPDALGTATHPPAAFRIERADDVTLRHCRAARSTDFPAAELLVRDDAAVHVTDLRRGPGFTG